MGGQTSLAKGVVGVEGSSLGLHVMLFVTLLKHCVYIRSLSRTLLCWDLILSSCSDRNTRNIKGTTDCMFQT